MNLLKKSFTLTFTFILTLIIQIFAVVPTNTHHVKFVGHGRNGSWHAYSATNTDLGTISREDAFAFRASQRVETNNCVVCLEPMTQEDCAPEETVFTCKHTQFHGTCIQTFLNTTTRDAVCPLCRAPQTGGEQQTRRLQLALGPQLIEAARNGRTATVNALIARGADVNYVSQWRETVRMWAASLGSETITIAILSAYATLIHAYQSWIAWAALNGGIAIVIALIAAETIVNHVNQRGNTALMWATRNGHTDIVNALRRAGATR